MKKSIPVVIAVIVIAGLAFYMGRQSVPAPVVGNPPVESNSSEVKETPESENLSTHETPEPDPPQFQGYTQDERYAAYEEAYTFCEGLAALEHYETLNAQIENEIMYCEYELYTSKDLATPKYHADDYMLWRNEFHPSNTSSDKSWLIAMEDELGIGNLEFFDSSIETVYAIQNVNMRDTFNEEGNVVDVLQAGQKITRLAIGFDKAEGWSKAVLSDGTIVYIKSQYLMTSKPEEISNTTISGNDSVENPAPPTTIYTPAVGPEGETWHWNYDICDGVPIKVPNGQDQYIRDQHDQSKTPLPEDYYAKWSEGIVDAMGYQIISENGTKYVLDTNKGIKLEVLYMTSDGGYYIGRTEHTGANATYHPVEWVWQGPITDGSTGEVITEAHYSAQGGISSGGNSDLPIDNSHLTNHGG